MKLTLIWFHCRHRFPFNSPCVRTIKIQKFSRRCSTVNSVAVADDGHFIERRLKPSISCDAFGAQLFYVSRISFDFDNSFIINFGISASIACTILAKRRISYFYFTRPDQPGSLSCFSIPKSTATIDPFANRIFCPFFSIIVPILIYAYFTGVLV